MTNSLHKKLGLPLKRSDIALRAIGNVSAGRTIGSCTIRMNSLNGKNSLNVQVHIFSVLSVNLPSFTLIDQQWSHLKGLELADPQFLKSRPIEIILEAGPVAYIMNDRNRKGPTNAPIAQSTLLSWIIYGSVSTPALLRTMNSLHVASVEVDLQLNELIAKFWEQEESRTSESICYSNDDSLCGEHYKTTHTRSADGR